MCSRVIKKDSSLELNEQANFYAEQISRILRTLAALAFPRMVEKINHSSLSAAKDSPFMPVPFETGN
jgi:hypothetical protein